MASATSSYTNTTPPSSDDMAIKAVNKRYEGLITVKTKAIEGKGAWYWAHLEPILVRNPDNNLPKTVKLKCTLCNSLFSASNPSRTASEHLKRGTCPNFSSVLTPISTLSPTPVSTIPLLPSSNNHRKRASRMGQSCHFNSLAMVESSRICSELGGQNQVVSVCNSNRHLVLSGGKEDLGALAMLEDSVKKLKSPKSSPGPMLNKDQIESAFEFLADWFYESCGSVSISGLEHPKFRAFLNQVGLPMLPRHEFLGSRLDSKFDEMKIESEARIGDAVFFQIASDGWKNKSCTSCAVGENLVKFMINLPNGTSVFQKAVFTGGGGPLPSKYVEEIMWEAITNACGGVVQRCVGIVADKYKSKALRNLEIQNHWMVNTSCQVQGILGLIKDFSKELPLFRKVTDNCLKLANFVNSNSEVRSMFLKNHLQELDHAGLLRVPASKCDYWRNFLHVYAMLEDILGSAQVLHLVVMNNSFKMISLEDPIAREVAGMVQDVGIWNELEAVHSLVKLITEMAQEIEAERPLIGQCLPLWKALSAKVKDWCTKFNIAEETVETIVKKRFLKNYHPAWAAAFVLDPLYLIRETSGKYLPPFKCLTHEQEKDVDKLITRLVSEDEAHIALMELMKWRSEGLEPLYAKAVQLKQRDSVTGKMKIANPQSRRLVWETCLSGYKSLGKVAVRLIFLHATSCGFKCNWSFLKCFCVQGHSRVGLERAQKMIFIAAHAKLERRDFSNEQEKDAEMLSLGSNVDDMLNEIWDCLKLAGWMLKQAWLSRQSTSENLGANLCSFVSLLSVPCHPYLWCLLSEMQISLIM